MTKGLPAAIARETLIVLCGALLAALIINQVLPPQVKAYVKSAWA